MIRRAFVFLVVAHAALTAMGGTADKREVSGMVTLAGGTFVMGTDSAAVDGLCLRFHITHRDLFLAEVPAHRVTVAPFAIDRTEVTNAAFKAFVDRHGAWAPGRVSVERQNGDYLKHWTHETFPWGGAKLPLTYVTWWAAKAYCEASGNRLPTEAEWEFAARGGLAAAEFPWGDAPPDPKRANWSGTGIGAPTQGRRVIRGGSFGGGPINLRVRYRDSHPAGGAGPHIGFRCARSIQNN